MKAFFARSMNPHSALPLAMALLFAMTGLPCRAQSVTQVKEGVATTRETKVDGLLHLTGPESVSIRIGETDPATYRYGKNVQFVDEAGKVVAREEIAPGTPVTVHTSSEPAGGMVTSRVVVHKSTATTAAPGGTVTVTTTVTENTEKRTKVNGVLVEKEPDWLMVKTEKEGNVTFLYSGVTEFMDSEGKHVDLIQMVPGLPLQVDFRQVGDRLEASRVTVRGRVKN